MTKTHLTLGITVYVVALILSGTNAHPISRNTPLELIILHNNDMHARFEQTAANSNTCGKDDITNNKCYGGFARVAYELKKFRAEANNGGTPVLYLNAGDTYTGTPWFTLYKDKIVTAFLNLLKPDAISLGNHEFDEGINGLVPFLNNAEFPVLAANLDLSKTPELTNTKALEKSTVFDVAGVKVGVIGYLTSETKILSVPNNVEYIDEVQAINAEAEVLRNAGVNIIIALGHSGYETDKAIGINCPLVDVVIGGHSHSFLYTGQYPDSENAIGPYPTNVTKPNGRNVPIVQAYAYTKYLGHLRLSFDASGNLISFDGKPILLSGEVPRDPDVLALLETYRPGLDALNSEVIGRTKVTLDGDCRFRECNLGNLVADTMVHSRAVQYGGIDGYWTDASIALIQGGGIRANVNVGNITHFDLMTILPFESRLVIINITGKDLLLVLERSVVRYSETIGNGEFLQYSGLHVTYNLTKPSGSRVESVQVKCASCTVPRYSDLEENRFYKVIITSFLEEGGDGYDMFLNKTTIPMETVDVQAAIDYIKAMKVIYPAVEWRITMNGKLVEQVDNGQVDNGQVDNGQVDNGQVDNGQVDNGENDGNNDASNVSVSFALIASMMFYIFLMQ